MIDNAPKHWKAYLNYLSKLMEEHEIMLLTKELEIRQAWDLKSSKEKWKDRLLLRPSVPDSISFKIELLRIGYHSVPDTEPSLEGYWTWLVERENLGKKMSREEVEKALEELTKGNELRWMKRKQKQ